MTKRPEIKVLFLIELRLIIPEARLISTSRNQDRKNVCQVMSPKEFIENTNPYFVENRLYEYDINREKHD
jgi:hypothetical protein